VHFARWDLSYVHIVDPATGTLLCRIFPVDKIKNADGRRRPFEDAALPADLLASKDEIATTNELPSLMRKLLEDYSALGIPPAYLSAPSPTKDSDQ